MTSGEALMLPSADADLSQPKSQFVLPAAAASSIMANLLAALRRYSEL